ncbi:MAG: ABC transporter substrate-binding protein, partial [Chloroflexota bacterium]|nr:ABC transporter substrate-binding protein [Chloroflexota bacterium]
MSALYSRSFLLLSILLVAAFGFMACDGDDDDKYRLGVMVSLRGPGETYGTVANQAKQMAVDEINAAGGVNGKMLELVVEDSKCNAQDAITAYNKLTDVDDIKIILGTSC